MTDLMIDLETMGTDPNCPIVSIGAVFFDVNTKQKGATFHMALDINEQIKRGRLVTGDTIKWWMQQSDAAKKIFSEHAKLASIVLPTFVKWYATNGLVVPQLPVKNRAFVWGNGATFDLSILEDAFRMYGIECPWGYNKAMDLRTFKRFKAPEKKVVVPGTAHNALDDAIGQADFVLENL